MDFLNRARKAVVAGITAAATALGVTWDVGTVDERALLTAAAAFVLAALAAYRVPNA